MLIGEPDMAGGDGNHPLPAIGIVGSWQDGGRILARRRTPGGAAPIGIRGQPVGNGLRRFGIGIIPGRLIEAGIQQGLVDGKIQRIGQVVISVGRATRPAGLRGDRRIH